jgi:hypothetical protein
MWWLKRAIMARQTPRGRQGDVRLDLVKALRMKAVYLGVCNYLVTTTSVRVPT